MVKKVKIGGYLKKNKAMSNREEAMTWWNNLSSARKTQICDTSTDLAGAARRWETLTGLEIEKLYGIEFSTGTQCYHPTYLRERTHRGYHCNGCGKRF